MTDLKIIIPMAGVGSRMGPLTRRRPKALVRLADKRLLDHVLSTFGELESTFTLEYVFIIGRLGEQIKEHMKRVHPEKNVTYFLQEDLRGQSHAVHLARDAISGPILLTYCDTINEIDFSFLRLGNIDGAASVQEVDDPRRHGIAVMGPDRLVTRLIEKPGTMEHKSVLTGLYYLSEGKVLIKAIEAQMQSGASLNNEYYLADAINILLNDGMRIRAEKALRWLDGGTPAALIEANACLLRHHDESHDEMIEGQSSVIIPPVYVHQSARIENSIIGPNVSIGENCSIERSMIENTIIDDDSNITEVTLANSLIGNHCSVNGSPMQSIVADYDGIRILAAVA